MKACKITATESLKPLQTQSSMQQVEQALQRMQSPYMPSALAPPRVAKPSTLDPFFPRNDGVSLHNPTCTYIYISIYIYIHIIYTFLPGLEFHNILTRLQKYLHTLPENPNISVALQALREANVEVASPNQQNERGKDGHLKQPSAGAVKA